tara:strand:+ start:284 stop:1021 length:738 start_codon:yes stop_codon:yes gene_type:complete
MTWFSLLKMPNPFGGKWEDLTRDEYYSMDDKNKANYHDSMRNKIDRQIKEAVTPRKAGQAPPATDDQIRELRELNRFHGRQSARYRRGSSREMFYSFDDETIRQQHLPRFDVLERRKPTTKEMYDSYTRKEKYSYWARKGNNEGNRMAMKIRHRMDTNPNYTPPFEGDELTEAEYRDKYLHRDVSEYDNFTDVEKRRYHKRKEARLRRAGGDRDLMLFHLKMYNRLRRGNFPTYPTPEAEKEAEQ